MKISFYLVFFVFTCLVSCGLYASDGNTDPCLIKGQVLDAVTKKPVSGVVVSAVVPGDPAFKEAITDVDGFYYFKQLPACHVNLRFEKKGYQKYKYEELIEIQDKKTIKVNVQVLPDGGAELLPDDSEYPLLRILGMK
jgi:Carboxypeptidase regulatory-like domain